MLFFASSLNQETKSPKLPPRHSPAYLLPAEITDIKQANALAAHKEEARVQAEEAATPQAPTPPTFPSPRPNPTPPQPTPPIPFSPPAFIPLMSPLRSTTPVRSGNVARYSQPSQESFQPSNQLSRARLTAAQTTGEIHRSNRQTRVRSKSSSPIRSSQPLTQGNLL